MMSLCTTLTTEATGLEHTTKRRFKVVVIIITIIILVGVLSLNVATTSGGSHYTIRGRVHVKLHPNLIVVVICPVVRKLHWNLQATVRQDCVLPAHRTTRAAATVWGRFAPGLSVD
eukprot:m.416221 g.416221  ORF g.416221 m.416221 type:complete len:116 (-) comp20182_c2_seq1:543-890(-)